MSFSPLFPESADTELKFDYAEKTVKSTQLASRFFFPPKTLLLYRQKNIASRFYFPAQNLASHFYFPAKNLASCFYFPAKNMASRFYFPAKNLASFDSEDDFIYWTTNAKAIMVTR
jgi:hypothetical protein